MSMIRRRISLGFALSVLCGVGICAFACSPKVDTPPSARVTSTCEQICTKRASCDAKTNHDACNSRCTSNSGVRKIDAFRRDIADGIVECINQGVCTKEFDVAAKQCALDRIKAQQPSEAVATECKKLEHSFSGCDLRWETPCVDELKVFPDEKMRHFDECLDQGCKVSGSCFRQTEDKLLRSEL